MHLNNRKKLRNTALLLCFALLLPLFSGCGAKEDAWSHYRDNDLPIGIEDADHDYFPGYEHYDPAKFYENCEKFESLLEKGDLEKAWEIYDRLYSDAVLVYDYQYTVDVGLDENVQNTWFAEEKNYIADVSVEVIDRFKSSCGRVAKGEHAEEFRAHVDSDDIFSEYEKYEPLTGAAKELMLRESELEVEYIAANDEVNASVADGTYDPKEANEKLGNIFVELVSVRRQIAKEKGYDNFAEYADDEYYHRDYTAEDLEVLKKAIKKYSKDFDYYSYYSFGDITMDGVDTETILCDVGETLSKISKRADDAYTLITNKSLISAGFESTRGDTQYTLGTKSTGSGIILLKHYDDSMLYNYRTFAHELGHFTHVNLVENPNPLFWGDGCMDVMELHSNFLEVLFAVKAGDIFTMPEYYQGYEIASLAEEVVSGCYYDDWQRAVYTSEKDLTLDEINAMFKEICLSYGIEEFQNMEYQWMWVGHNFTSPMYYISYATSSFAALELFALTFADFDGAVRTWENVLLEDPYHEGYFAAVENIGLSRFTEPGLADEILSAVCEFLRVTEQSVYNPEGAEDEEPAEAAD